MRKKVLFLFLFLVSVLVLSFCVSAGENVNTYEPIFLISYGPCPGVYQVCVVDSNGYTPVDEFYFSSEFFDYLNENYDDYLLNSENYDSFSNYMGHIDTGLESYSDIKSFIDSFETTKKSASEDSSGGNDNEGGQQGGSSGGNTGDSESGGASGGKPNVTVNNEYTEDMYSECYCSSSDGLCDCYKKGFDNGWFSFIFSDNMKDALLQAFNQGFAYLTSSTYEKEIINAQNDAVAQFKFSDEYKQDINTAKTEAVNEYKSSQEHTNEINNAKEESKSEFVEKIQSIINGQAEADEGPESDMISIIGEAQEGAKADLVVEVESVLAGEKDATEGAASDMVSLVNQKVQEGITDFSQDMESILNGESVPEAGTPQADLSATIDVALEKKYNDASENAVNNYKDSEEYDVLIENTYYQGVEAGKLESTTKAESIAFNNGKLEGYAEFQGSDLYQRNLKNYYNTGYREGFADGSDVEYTNPSSVIVVLIVALFLVVGYRGISRFIKKKKQGR